MIDVFEEAAVGELGQFRLPMRLPHLGDRNTCVPECFENLVTTALDTPLREVLVY